jgi:hypothetical protein
MPWIAPTLMLALTTQPLPEVQLHYQERPPYYQSTPEGPQGLVAAPLRQALRLSGLPHHFHSTPALRQLQLIEQGQALVCGVGWFQNPERAAKGKFSKPLYQDRPLAMLVREQLGWTHSRSMAEALSDTQARLLVKTGYSYGSDFDRLLAARSQPPLTITGEMAATVRMLAGDRADWTPMAPEEAEAELAAGASGLRLLAFSDAATGNRRYLYCNKAVPESWLQRLDAALPNLPEPARR